MLNLREMREGRPLTIQFKYYNYKPKELQDMDPKILIPGAKSDLFDAADSFSPTISSILRFQSCL